MITTIFLLGASLLPAQAVDSKKPERPNPEAIEFFEKKVRPLLVENCQSCHGAEKQKGALRLDSLASVLKGGDSGPAVVPGKPEKSLLIRTIHYRGEDDAPKMPPKAKLNDAALAAFADWVKMGAPWPENDVVKGPAKIADVRQSHWAFQPVKKPAIPLVTDREWAKAPIDAFILAGLEPKGLKPSVAADRRTIIRRVSFDLIGLPPTPDEVEAFVADLAPDSYEKLIDRLLASPRYGERWGRHWLDLARYADTKGYVFTEERRFPYSYTYRDYVIRSFNEDLPYDQFILQQLAADQLPLGDDKRPLAAMGYLTLGRRFLNNTHDIIDDRIDVTMRGLQGLTVACARCHDHKFDPIPTKDYYSLYGVFSSSTEPKELPLIGKPEQTAAMAVFEKELAVRQAKVDEYFKTSHAELLKKVREHVGDYLLGVRDSERSGADKAAPELAKADLNNALLMRWKAFLTQAGKTHDPVFQPWFAVAALPTAEFEKKAPEIINQIVLNADPKKPINPLIAEALADVSPKSLKDVAKCYTAAFAGVEMDWQAALKSAADKKTTAPKALSHADQEALRQVLYSDKSPANIPLEGSERFMGRDRRDKITDLKKKVDNWKATAPGAPPRAMVLNDAPNPHDSRILVRGNPGNQGEVAPRRFLEVLTGEKRTSFNKGSGRLELAQAIASRDNPLTARVLVNRVWQHHFGQGLVRTPGDFGLRGDVPTHPELLDYLASKFMDNGWSIKKLHREILLSNTYRQISESDERTRLVDPENRLLSHQNRHRLEFEGLRDNLLAASGRLDLTMGGPGDDITVLTPIARRRTIYAFVERQNLPGIFRTFDFASPDSSTSQRYQTTVPQQALFLLNSPFTLEMAKAFAARADVTALPTDEARIERMYQIAFGRLPEPEEKVAARQFLTAAPQTEAQAKLTPWERYAQVLLLSNEFAFVD